MSRFASKSLSFNINVCSDLRFQVTHYWKKRRRLLPVQKVSPASEKGFAVTVQILESSYYRWRSRRISFSRKQKWLHPFPYFLTHINNPASLQEQWACDFKFVGLQIFSSLDNNGLKRPKGKTWWLKQLSNQMKTWSP